MEDHKEDIAKILLDAIAGSVWSVRPVQDQPQVVLEEWQAYELPDGNRHLVGRNADHGTGRVSSRIVAFDPATRCARTGSGRVYELPGPPGCDGDAQYVWAIWRRINAVASCREVSQELEQTMQAPAEGDA